MTIQSGGNSDDPKKDSVEEEHGADNNDDLDATRILPMRAPDASASRTVIGKTQASAPEENARGDSGDPQKGLVEEGHGADADDDLEATRILPMRAPAASASTTVIGTTLEPALEENWRGDSDERKDHLAEEEYGADADDELEATRILPMRTPAASAAGSLIGTMQEPPTDEDQTEVIPADAQRDAEANFNPVVGWLVILEGPGRGENCPLFYGQNSIGRGEDQRVQLNFGDARITRDTHAYLVYDDVERRFYLRDNGKANLIRLNNVAVMVPTEVADRDIISIGETVMLFVALCGTEFDWLKVDDGPNPATGA